MLDKVPPTAFLPPPKVFSRLLYFKPREQLIPIPDELEFWKFIKLCFLQPRRTLKNNLGQTHFDMTRLSEDLLKKRAQELQFADFLHIWDTLRAQ
jgi:16S rRNA (adenine1518-N6/adenine1519-N6)-dimethyltransferase